MKTGRIQIIWLLLLGACTGADKQPDWVERPPQVFPTPQYLTATGVATEPEQAKNRALVNLAKIFLVELEDVSYDETQVWQDNTDKGDLIQGQQQFANRIVTAYTQKQLQGAHVVEQWYDPKETLHYALAVISRAQLSTALTSEIRKYDQVIANAVNAANTASQSGESFIAARYYYKALQQQQKRDLLQRDLQIVDPTGRGVPSVFTIADLQKRLQQNLQVMTIHPEYPKQQTQLQDYLDYAISVIGAAKVPATDAAYQLDAKLNIEDRGIVDDWYWYRGQLEMQLSPNNTDAAPLSIVQWSLKTAGQTQQQAAVRLQQELLQYVQEHFLLALLQSNEPETGD